MDRTNRALLVTVLLLGSLLLLRLGQQAMVDPPGFDVPAFSMAEVPLFSVCTPHQCAAFERGPDGVVRFLPPDQDVPVDQGKARALLEAWAGGRATKYKVAAEVQGRVSGLFGTNGDETLTLRFERARDEELLSLEVGAEAPDGGRFVQREGDRAVFVMDVPRVDLLSARREYWIDGRGTARQAHRLEAFGITSPAGELAFAREGDDWVATTPMDLRPDPRAIDRLLDQIGQFTSLPLVPPDDARSGGPGADGQDAAPIVTVWTRAGDQTTRYTLAEASEGFLTLRTEGRPEVRRAARDVGARLSLTPDQLRDRVLLDLAVEPGLGVRWARGARAVELTFDGAWQGPGGVLADLPLAMSGLQPLRGVGELPGPPEERASGELTIRVPGAEPVAVAVWPPRAEGVPVSIGGTAALVSPGVIERLDALLD